jgi:antitoxin HicB
MREQIMKLKVLLRSEDVGGYSISVPALPGCHSQGETVAEALANIREAAELWLEVAGQQAMTSSDGETANLQVQEIEL